MHERNLGMSKSLQIRTLKKLDKEKLNCVGIRKKKSKDQGEGEAAIQNWTKSFMKYSLNLYYFLVSSTKGQLISKWLFGFFNYPKKRKKNFCPSRVVQKLTY